MARFDKEQAASIIPQADTAFGGTGQDLVWIHLDPEPEVSDTFWGSVAEDAVKHGWDADTAFGGSDEDEVKESWKADTAFGGSAEDLLFDEPLGRTFDGSSAEDTIAGYVEDTVVEYAEDTIDFNPGDDLLMLMPVDDLADTITASDAEDALVDTGDPGDEAADTLIGLIGEDWIFEGGSADPVPDDQGSPSGGPLGEDGLFEVEALGSPTDDQGAPTGGPSGEDMTEMLALTDLLVMEDEPTVAGLPEMSGGDEPGPAQPGQPAPQAPVLGETWPETGFEETLFDLPVVPE